MNIKEKQQIRRARDLLTEATAILQGVRNSHQERVDAMQECNLAESERCLHMEEQQGTLEELCDTLENAEADFDNLEV
jgi:hypothetical protein